MTTVEMAESRVDEATWHHVDESFWSGSRSGEFFGTIELVDCRYRAYGEFGQSLGDYATFVLAVAAIDAARVRDDVDA
jgi:hypothetical protein